MKEIKELYKKNFKGKKWSESRKLTTKAINWYKKKKDLHARGAFKEMFNPHFSTFRSIYNDIRLHNRYVRKAWKNGKRTGKFNHKESVLELYIGIRDETLTVKHVDHTTAVKEKVYISNEGIEDPHAEHVFGNSELPKHLLDSWTLSHDQVCAVVDRLDIIETLTGGT